MAGRYCTEADLVPSLVNATLLAQLTNDDPDATATDDTVLDGFFADAEAEVDGYLGVRYDLPLADVPTLVVRLVARITRYRLYTSRPGEPEEAITKDYEAAIKTLEGIAGGTISLGLTPAGGPTSVSPRTGRRVRTSSRPPVFGRGNLEGF